MTDDRQAHRAAAAKYAASTKGKAKRAQREGRHRHPVASADFTYLLASPVRTANPDVPSETTPGIRPAMIGGDVDD
jgi:hypothetical protein